MNVPFVDLSRFHGPIRPALHAAALEVIDSGRYIGGETVRAFEQQMAAWLGVDEICGVSCATMGIFAVLKGHGIGPGDEVIVPVHTAIAVSEAVTLAGATPVFCDIEPGYHQIDPAGVRARLSPQTRAVVAVHLYGQPADMDSLLDIAGRHDLLLVEDCAQSQGARYGDAFVGTLGDASVFSFFPSKNLGGFGDGGAVWARDPKQLRRIRIFCNHGRTEKYWHEFEGVNSRLDALQAALLRVCLPRLDTWNAMRRQAAAWYEEHLEGISGIVLPRTRPGTEPICHVYVVHVSDRDVLRAELKEQGIGTGLHYPHPLHLLPAYARFRLGPGSFPNAEHACAHMLSLPMFPGITRDEVRHVCGRIAAHLKR